MRRKAYLVVFSITHRLPGSVLTEVFPIYFYANSNRDARRMVVRKLREWSTYNSAKLYKLKSNRDKFIGAIVR